MTLNLLKPINGQPKRPSELRDNMQHLLGVALPDCILPEDDQAYGFKITAQTGLTVRVGAGRGIIGKKYHDDRNYHDITLPARMACLLYKLKNTATDSVTPSDGYIQASIPTAYIDNNTVAFWNFTDWDGASAVPNSAVGISSIAVACPVTKTGSVNRVDGWCGYGAKGGGSTGYFTSANSTNVPIGASEREISILFTPSDLTSFQTLLTMGTASTNYQFAIQQAIGGNVKISNYTTTLDTNFTVEMEVTYNLTVGYDGSSVIVYINGYKVYTGALSLNTQISNVVIGQSGASSYFFKSIFHYIELRNKMRTPAQIAQISNKLLLLCSYKAENVTPAIIDLPLLIGEWHSSQRFQDVNAKCAFNYLTTSYTPINTKNYLNTTNNPIFTTSTIVAKDVFTLMMDVVINAWGGHIYGNQTLPPGNGWPGNGIIIILTNATTITISYGLSTSAWYGSTIALSTPLVLGKPFKLSFVSNAGASTFEVYIDGELKGSSTKAGVIGYSYYYGTSVMGIYNYSGAQSSGSACNGFIAWFAFVNKAMSGTEILNAIENYERQEIVPIDIDIREVLPADTIALGFVRTNSTAVIEVDTKKRKYGRVEGATGGNRRADIEWKYVTVGITKDFDNPFCTENITASEIWYKKNLTDSSHSIIDCNNSGDDRGVYVKNVSSNAIKVQIGANYILGSMNSYTGSAETTGYIAVITEVLE